MGFPHSEDYVSTLRWWDFSHSEVSKQTCPRALSAILRESKSSAVGFSHSKSPTLLQEFSLSEPPLDVLLMGFSPLGTQALAYRLLSSELTSRWISGSFSLPRSFHPYYDAGELPFIFWWWDYPNSRDNSVLRFFSHIGQLHCWVYSHSEVPDRHYNLFGAPNGTSRV